MTTVTPSADSASVLKTFLAAPERPEDTLTYHQLQGFLFGVTCSPEMIPPSDWIPVIFDDQEATYASEQEAGQVLGLVMELYNVINDDTFNERSALPADCPFRDPVLDNLEEDAPVSQWCQGFMAAYHWLEAVWDEYTTQDHDEDLGATLMVLSLFASRAFATDVVEEGEPTDGNDRRLSLEEYAETAREVFNDAMLEFADLSRAIQEAHLREPAKAPATSTKVGRNAPCPCGSGRKYKNCCGSNVH